MNGHEGASALWTARSLLPLFPASLLASQAGGSKYESTATQARKRISTWTS